MGSVAGGKSTVEMKGFAEGHYYMEFLDAIRGEGNWYEQINSRCFSDIEYCVPQMEGILVGCIAQQVPGKLVWDAATQSFAGGVGDGDRTRRLENSAAQPRQILIQ